MVRLKSKCQSIHLSLHVWPIFLWNPQALLPIIWSKEPVNRLRFKQLPRFNIDNSHPWTKTLIWALVHYLALSGKIEDEEAARVPMLPPKKQPPGCIKSWYWRSDRWIRVNCDQWGIQTFLVAAILYIVLRPARQRGEEDWPFSPKIFVVPWIKASRPSGHYQADRDNNFLVIRSHWPKWMTREHLADMQRSPGYW